jgi:hypothetical protein
MLSKAMNLKFAGRCKNCGIGLAKGTRAVWSIPRRCVFCASCYSNDITVRRDDYVNDLWIEQWMDDYVNDL